MKNPLVTIRTDTIRLDYVSVSGLIEPQNTEVFILFTAGEKLSYRHKTPAQARRTLDRFNKRWARYIGLEFMGWKA